MPASISLDSIMSLGRRRGSRGGGLTGERVTRDFSPGTSSSGRFNNGCVAEDDLYEDVDFPPDQSSLTYVYTGEHKYERMVFMRPKGLYVSPTFYGMGGACDFWMPWQQWRERQWILQAAAVVSLNSRYTEQLIPGYREFKQNFHSNYTGCFRLRLWRFGEWVEEIVDDLLPVLDGRLAYCPAAGNPPEFWLPLLEKAYAKCHLAYEAIETGDFLNALTDMTGAICEHLKVKGTPFDIFHTLYKSMLNRSFISCWRRANRMTHAEFPFPRRYQQQSQDGSKNKSGQEEEARQHLFIVTAVTKFPMRDGSMEEMIRVKDPLRPESMWSGDFCISDTRNWHRVNPQFIGNYRPCDCCEKNEAWMTYLDFCRYFGDVIICSSTEPYRSMDTTSERKYKKPGASEFTDLMTTSASMGMCEKKLFAGRREMLAPPMTAWPRRVSVGVISHSDTDEESSHHTGCVQDKYRVASSYSPDMDHTVVRRSRSEKDAQDKCTSQTQHYKRCNSYHVRGKDRAAYTGEGGTRPREGGTGEQQSRGSSVYTNSSSGTSGSGQAHTHSHHSLATCNSTLSVSVAVPQPRKASFTSYISGASLVTNEELEISSTSDVSLMLRTREARSASACRMETQQCITPESQASIFESHMDYFRSRSRWKELVFLKGKWTKSTAGGSRSNLAKHSKNPRVCFTVTKAEATEDFICPASLQGKSQIIISLMQNYRLGVRRANSCVMKSVGFCLYKTKNADRQEKKSLSRMSVIADVTSTESREVTSRFDLEPGNYLLVPYIVDEGHEGQFLVRILGEQSEPGQKAACVIS